MAVSNTVPTINGVAYSHADLVITYGVVPLIGVISLEYGDTQEITGNYSTGHEATSVSFGQNVNTATLTLSFEAMQLLQLAAPQGKIQNYPAADLGINFLPVGQLPTRDVLRQVRFKGRQQTTETGNSEIPVTLELWVAKIDYQRI